MRKAELRPVRARFRGQTADTFQQTVKQIATHKSDSPASRLEAGSGKVFACRLRFFEFTTHQFSFSNIAMLSQTHMSNSHRGGFTMVELMIVIVIIAVLVGMLMPALQSVMINARDVKVRTELSQLETAIGAFKATYGVEPPSQIIISLNGVAWDARSQAIIRRIWPQFDFTMPTTSYPAAWTASAADNYSAGRNTAAGIVSLNSGECLAFFLGGIQTFTDSDGDGMWDLGEPLSLSGFSKDPAHPFIATGTSRDGPFYEFAPGRWSDVDGNHNPEYRDSLPSQTAPILYFSSYDGTGYRNTAVPGGEMPTNFPSVYTQPGGTAYYKPQSFQLISPGADATYGAGGNYAPNTQNNGLTNRSDHDNITNFSSGRLLPR